MTETQTEITENPSKTRRAVVLINPSSAGGRTQRRSDSILGDIARHFIVDERVVTKAKGHARELGSQLKTAEHLIVVGGDGTLSEVADGLLRARDSNESLPTIHLYPSGTGGDFARSLGLRHCSFEYAARYARPVAIDVGLAKGPKGQRYFINEFSAGLSGAVVRHVDGLTKKLGGALGFFTGTLRGILNAQPKVYDLVLDGKVRQQELSLLVVANGSWFGGGMNIAPKAELDDGFFDIIQIKPLGLLSFLRHSPRLYRGAHLDLDMVEMSRVKQIELKVEQSEIDAETDGEGYRQKRFKLSVLPKALKVSKIG